MDKKTVIVRGGGDIATGTIQKLWGAGIPVLVLEAGRPSAIRRQVALSEAVYDGQAQVEGMHAVRIPDLSCADAVLGHGDIPVLVDEEGAAVKKLSPPVCVDAILAKKNLGTSHGRFPGSFLIALGPGFCAGKEEGDVDAVIETMRGHNLGRIITEGSALPDTGVPGSIKGETVRRVIHAGASGVMKNVRSIGDMVEEGEVIAQIVREDGSTFPVRATLTGLLRGLLRDGYPVSRGFKIADIDPRKEEIRNCFTISDKARCIGGSVLELAVRKLYGTV